MSNPESDAARGTSAALILSACALAGAAGLSYEVAWTHALALAAGNSQRALAIVLAGFLGGMAIGGWWAGRPAISRRPPLRTCGFLECALGGVGLAYPWLLGRMPGAAVALVGMGLPSGLARLVIVAAVVLPPTIVMGMTFPLWVRAVIRAKEQSVGRATALVSAAQVAGAAVGAFMAGFVIVPDHGYAAASWIAGSIDLVIGIALVVVAIPEAGDVASAPSTESVATSSAARRFGWAFVLCGFASIGYQVVWTRSLVFFFDGFHYAFAAVLVSFLVGLGLGAWAVAALARRVAEPGRWLSATQILCGGLGLVTWFAVPAIGEPASAARALDGYPMRVLGLSALVLVLPAAALGTTLPLATWVATRATREIAAGLSRAYAQVTVGNAVAAAAVPLSLVPALGLKVSWLVLVIANAAAAALLARRFAGRLAGAALASAAVIVLVWQADDGDPLILSSHVFQSGLGRDRVLLESRDGESCSVAVVRDLNHGATALYTDTFAAAATGREYPYMRLLGHLPTLLVERPRRSLVICFGTGTTAGAVSLHHEVETLRMVDVEEEVFAVADRFRDVNHAVLDGREGLRVERVVEDGRFDLLCATDPYDVITLEPLMPYTLGAVSFYTREFYELARDRLAEGGVLCQWIPVHAIPIDDYRSLVKTFVDVFPDGHLYFFEQSSLLVARRGGDPVRIADVTRRASRPAVLADLNAALVDSGSDLVAGHVAGGPVLRRVLRDDPVMSDDRPWVAFRTVRPEANPRQPLRDTLQFLVDCAEAEAETPNSSPLVDVGGLSEGGASELQGLVRLRRDLLAARLLEAETWLAGSTTGEAVSFRPPLDAYGQATVLHPDHREGATLVRRLSFFLERQQAGSALLRGEPLKAFHMLDRYRGTPEWTLDADAMQALALLAAGDAVGASMLAARIVDVHERHALAIAVLEKAAALADDGSAMARARSLEGDVPAGRLAEQRGLVARAQEASRTQSGAPLIAFRKALAKVVATDVLADPDAMEAAVETLRLRSGNPLVTLLAASVLRDLDEDPPSIETVRAVALLGIGRAGGRLRDLETSDAAMRTALIRCEAALVPDVARFRELLRSDDVVVRRLATAFAAGRGGRDHAPELLRGLEDPDDQVRLYSDRALRALTGRNAGFDYLAEPAKRAAAVAKWRTLVEQ